MGSEIAVSGLKENSSYNFTVTTYANYGGKYHFQLDRVNAPGNRNQFIPFYKFQFKYSFELQLFGSFFAIPQIKHFSFIFQSGVIAMEKIKSSTTLFAFQTRFEMEENLN